jgi:hypothetical protein
MNTITDRQSPLAALAAEEAARVCPDLDLGEWCRVGRQALDMAADTAIDLPRRAVALQIGFASAGLVARLMRSASARRERSARVVQ